MNSIQILLTIVVISLTILLIVVGVQVLLVIMDMRRSVRRLNTILEDSILGGGLIRPDKLTNVLDFFRKKKNNQDEGQRI
ncbi:hypothetical protein BH10PAT1_BH10PAT1_1410 [soil metagenome]